MLVPLEGLAHRFEVVRVHDLTRDRHETDLTGGAPPVLTVDNQPPIAVGTHDDWLWQTSEMPHFRHQFVELIGGEEMGVVVVRQ